jgi:hypothetical protein
MGLVTERHRHELATQGFTIVPNVISEALAARAIRLMDGLIGSIGPIEQVPQSLYQAGP